jgi:hypothetical protein
MKNVHPLNKSISSGARSAKYKNYIHYRCIRLAVDNCENIAIILLK